MRGVGKGQKRYAGKGEEERMKRHPLSGTPVSSLSLVLLLTQFIRGTVCQEHNDRREN